ncbi:hypothetical protein AMTRI_Chr09g42660 [Amborella trichopoda]|uniref:C3H1-type domain-containing protein n=1 Tax=Amborella trichopoda TaxID=13333 RepID=U5DG49_AMBTC|nr:zinc finger CCCH domain-containing protein 17 [Amborella trichopoda]XP_011628379.1 zinc finger CCCH domain-containing protein 17 [Amborella trichopoda]ERN19403.1 hypothetical protein AMTR_s00069p00156070 [Amborella trichopoda]|eukprot:XP_006857936.1 zinc finger CCCH domain-containing protein 17 [Amborella trichopoda]
MDLDVVNNGGNKRMYHRAQQNERPSKVCYYWLEGRCTRENCKFLHGELPSSNGFSQKRSLQPIEERISHATSAGPRRGMPLKWFRGQGDRQGDAAPIENRRKVQNKICTYWIAGNCRLGDECKFLHSHFVGESMTFLTMLSGHEKAVRGIALPMDSEKLFTGSQDESVRVWDCQTGQCVGVINLGGEVGCMISEGPWVFVGIPNTVKAWNTKTSTDLSLEGPCGQVHTLAVGNEMLFAGIQDGSILAWKFSVVGNCFEPAASLSGHTRSVVSLVVGLKRIYSGSMDNTIKVWDLDTLQCLQTLSEHSSVVMSLLCWDQFLLSCSLDRTIKVWVATGDGSLEVTYTHNEEHGVLALCGMHDAQAKPVLLCSCNDNTVRLYDLPSFNERGRLFSKEEVRAIQVGSGGLFFTGDGNGDLKIWKFLTE